MRPLLLILAALFALPAAAQADVIPFGSDLSGAADVDQSHGEDTAFWNVALANGGAVTAPAEGHITAIKVKGGVLTRTGDNKLARQIHFQVLDPTADGPKVRVSSADFYLPRTNDQQVVTTYEEPELVNICVNKGDFIDLNTIGGAEFAAGGDAGSALQVFSRTPGSTVNWYESGGGTNNGAVFPRQVALNNTELLLQAVLSTGPDASDFCPGGYRQHIFRGLAFPAPTQPTVKTKTRRVRLKGECNGENYGGCFGELTLSAVIDGASRTLGQVDFSIAPGVKNTIEIPISEASVLAIQKAKILKGTLTAVAHDNPRGDARVKWDSVPRQEKTTTDEISLKPDRPACVVPGGLIGKSSASAKAKLKAAGCGNVVKFKKVTKSKQWSKVVSVKPKAGTVLPAGTRVTLTIGRRK
ncbi:MAG TPA: PASTA domain-containing protein [Thermoleophilaceae bacterium]